MRKTLLTLALAFAVAAPAAAQQLTVAFNDGLVTVDATAVPVRTILNEWAKKGGTKLVGVERVSGAPLTVKLIDVPEAKALEVILRSVAGYMAAPRSTGSGASRYDRIMVMATSSTPPPAAPTREVRPSPAQMNGIQRFVPPQRQTNDDEDEDEDEDQNLPNPPVFTFPGAPGPNGQPGFQQFLQQQQQNGQPMIMNPGQTITINPATPQSAPPNMPFGSTTPGVITAPPQPGQRPPGGRQQR
jgi:hypothetical protein